MKTYSMIIPEQVKNLANSNGFNAIGLVKYTQEESIYSISCVDAEGFVLPIGLPHYIIDHNNGLLSLFCDEDFHITNTL